MPGEESRLNRWPSAADLLAELRRIAGVMRSAGESRRFPKLIPENRAAAASVLLTLLLSAGAALFLSRPKPPVVPPAPTATVQLAVLPLRMVGDVVRGDEYLAVGIADSIITRLAGVRHIGLRPTAAVIRYADSPPDTATVAKALAVG